MTATEDGPLEYLYIKDKTWTTVGLSVEEAVPDKATTLEEAHQEFKQSGWAPGKGEIRKDTKKSSAVVEGLENCYYSIIETFDMPPASANRRYLFDGVRMRFEFNEAVQGFEQTQRQSPHELFWYLLCGELEARVGDENEQVGSGGVIHIPKGESYHILSEKNKCVRYLNVCSTPVLESVLEE